MLSQRWRRSRLLPVSATGRQDVEVVKENKRGVNVCETIVKGSEVVLEGTKRTWGEVEYYKEELTGNRDCGSKDLCSRAYP